MAVGGGEDDHVVLVAAGGEEDVILGVQRQASAASALAGDVILADHLHGGGVDDGDGVLVFDVDVDAVFAVELALLRRAADVDGGEYGTVLIVDDGDVWRGVREVIEAVVHRIVEVAIWIALDRYGLDDGEGLGVEHGDGAGSGEAVAGRVVDDRAVRAGVGDVADLGEGVERKDTNMASRAGARDVKGAVGGVGADVVHTAIATDLDGLEDLVWAGLRVGKNGEWKQNGEAGEYEQFA